jgi:hypothetical protein
MSKCLLLRIHTLVVGINEMDQVEKEKQKLLPTILASDFAREEVVKSFEMDEKL